PRSAAHRELEREAVGTPLDPSPPTRREAQGRVVCLANGLHRGGGERRSRRRLPGAVGGAQVVGGRVQTSRLGALACVLSAASAPGWLSSADAAVAAGWAAQPASAPAVPNGQLSSLSCASETFCVAVGTGRNSAGVRVALAAHWDGKRWSV